MVDALGEHALTCIGTGTLMVDGRIAAARTKFVIMLANIVYGDILDAGSQVLPGWINFFHMCAIRSRVTDLYRKRL